MFQYKRMHYALKSLSRKRAKALAIALWEVEPPPPKALLTIQRLERSLIDSSLTPKRPDGEHTCSVCPLPTAPGYSRDFASVLYPGVLNSPTSFLEAARASGNLAHYLYVLEPSNADPDRYDDWIRRPILTPVTSFGPSLWSQDQAWCFDYHGRANSHVLACTVQKASGAYFNYPIAYAPYPGRLMWIARAIASSPSGVLYSPHPDFKGFNEVSALVIYNTK